MKLLRFALLLSALSFVAVRPSQAQVTPVPPLMNFQGRLTKPDGTPVSNGNYSLRFSFWTAATEGTEKWNQTINPVTVRNGAFAVLLNTSTGAPDKFNGNLWLEIKIGTDTPLAPRQQLVTVAYAFKADSVKDGGITTASVAAGAITNAKIASVDWTKITNPPSTLFALPYVGVLDDPAHAAITLTAKINAIIAYGNTVSAPPLYAQNNAANSIGYFAANGFGAYGSSQGFAGVYGTSTGGNGVYGETYLGNATGVFGVAQTSSATGVNGKHAASGNNGYLGLGNCGVYGDAVNASSNGVWGHANSAASGVYGVNDGTGPGVYGFNSRAGGTGVYGYCEAGTAVSGVSVNRRGVSGTSTSGTGVYGISNSGDGVDGASTSNNGVYGVSSSGRGVYGVSTSGTGVFAENYSSSSAALYATNYVGGPALYAIGQAAGTTSWGSISDARYKVQVATLDHALDNILRLRGVTYAWDRERWPDMHFAPGRQIGFIAQEMEQVFPELVQTDAKGYKSVTYATLTPILVEAIKTQQKQLDDKQQQIEALKSRLDAIERMLTELKATHR